MSAALYTVQCGGREGTIPPQLQTGSFVPVSLSVLVSTQPVGGAGQRASLAPPATLAFSLRSHPASSLGLPQHPTKFLSVNKRYAQEPAQLLHCPAVAGAELFCAVRMG